MNALHTLAKHTSSHFGNGTLAAGGAGGAAARRGAGAPYRPRTGGAGRRAEALRQPAKEENLDFIHRIETGEAQPDAERQQIADTMRQMLDERRQAVQALGTGKLQSLFLT